MSGTQQPNALRLANQYEIDGFLQEHRFAKDFWCRQAAVELRHQHAPTTGAADLPEALRVPLDSLHADAAYLCGRLLNGSLTQEQVVESIRRRIDAAKAAIRARASHGQAG